MPYRDRVFLQIIFGTHRLAGVASGGTAAVLMPEIPIELLNVILTGIAQLPGNEADCYSGDFRADRIFAINVKH